MHKVIRIVGLFLIIALACPVRAGEFKVEGIIVDVPVRFEGPVSAQSDASIQTSAFTVPASSLLSPSSVLQITVYDADEDARAGRPADVSQRYLLQMLEGIERRRTDYRESSPEEIQVAGLPGSMTTWQGKANGIGTNGKMYCIVTESALVFFHVMGGGSVPNADMAAAIQAVESARQH